MYKNRIIVYVVIVLLLVVIGVSFGYFGYAIRENGTGNIRVSTDVTMNLTFDVTKPISLTLNQSNFVLNGGNISDEAYAKAILLGGTNTNPVSGNYYAYLNITRNDFVYTTVSEIPEVLLNIYDPSNTEITSITGLTYNNTYHAFDITEFSGLIPIVLNEEIVSRSNRNATEESWKVVISANNLNTNQIDNEGAVLNATLIIQAIPYQSS